MTNKVTEPFFDNMNTTKVIGTLIDIIRFTLVLYESNAFICSKHAFWPSKSEYILFYLAFCAF